MRTPQDKTNLLQVTGRNEKRLIYDVELMAELTFPVTRFLKQQNYLVFYDVSNYSYFIMK